MTAAGQVKDALLARLRAEGLDAAGEYERERLRQYTAPVAVVGAQELRLRGAGLAGYLGTRVNPETAEPVEVYGQALELTLSLELYVPRGCGAACADETAEAVSLALLAENPGGVRVREITWMRRVWDERSGMFLLRGSVDCAALFAAEPAQDGPALRKFILEGALE